MKRKIILVLLSIISFSLVAQFVSGSSDIWVIKPVDGQLFEIGDNLITWRPPDDVGHVKIELYKDGSRIKAIDTWVDNTGEFIWVITSDDVYRDGCDYQIKIVNGINDNHFGYSSRFCIYLYGFSIPDSTIYLIVFIVIIIVVLFFYDRKTHKIRIWATRIKNRLKRKKKK